MECIYVNKVNSLYLEITDMLHAGVLDKNIMKKMKEWKAIRAMEKY